MIPLKDNIPSRFFPVMTWLILGANAIVFFFELAAGPLKLNWLVSNFALTPARWFSSPVWFGVTLFTSMFMHSGWLHFLSNMWILFIFGDNVEDRMGPLGFLLFYLFSGLAAGLMQTVIDPFSTIPVLGASGAIAGVLGAYILMYPGARVVTLVPLFFIFTTINIPAFFYLGFWFISQLFSGVASLATMAGGVAWWAHIGGFIAGLFLSRFFRWRPLPPARPRITYQDVYRLPPDRPDRW